MVRPITEGSFVSMSALISSKLNLRVFVLKQGMIFTNLLAKRVGHLGPLDD